MRKKNKRDEVTEEVVKRPLGVALGVGLARTVTTLTSAPGRVGEAVSEAKENFAFGWRAVRPSTDTDAEETPVSPANTSRGMLGW